MPTLKHKKDKKKREGKHSTGLYRTAIIHRCIHCVVWESNPAPCNAAYATFGNKGLITKLKPIMYVAVGTTQLVLVCLQDVSANLGLCQAAHIA
jgi:hypothetical protein